MPVFMRLDRLIEARPFLGWLSIETIHHAGFAQDTINRRRTDRDDILIEHHERQPTISFQGVASMEIQDCILLPVFKPEVSWNRSIVFVCLTVAFLPIEVLARSNSDPSDDLFGRCLGTLGPIVDVIDNLISRVVGNPVSF